jgi:iron complex outermembrane receptor protein
MTAKKTSLPAVAAPALLALAGTLAPAASLADDLAPITVTASRYPTRLEDAPGQVEVLTADDLHKRHITRLGDALNLAPGIHVQPGRGMLQPSQNMAMRGIPDERRVQVLLDGVPLNDGYLGGLNFGALPADGIDQVEVLYGPMSSLYGGSAMGGVVSYTTRMPRKTEFDFRAGYGNPFEAGKGPENVQKLSLSAGTRLDNGLSILAGGHWSGTDGYRSELVTSGTAPAGLTGWSPMQQKNGAAGYLLGNKGRTRWEEDSERLKLEQRLADGSRWRFGWQRQAYVYATADSQSYLRTGAGAESRTCCGVPATVTEASFLNGEGAYERNLYQLGYDTEVAEGILKVSAAYAAIAANSYVTPTTGNRNGGGGRINDGESQSTFIDAYWNRQLGAHGLTLGVSLRQDRALNQEYTLSNWRDPASKTALYATGAGKADTTGVYVQDQWHLTPALTAHLGLRHDYWRNSDGSVQTPGWTPAASRIFQNYPSRTESAWSPKLAVHYKVTPNFSLRSSLGSAFRAPSVYELYRSGKIGSTTYLANPNLKPETVETWDVGADFKPWDGGEVKATLFANRMHDLIYTQGGSGGTKNRINAELAESRGVTVSFSQQLTAASRVFGSLTYTDSEVKRNSVAPASVGKQLTSLPKRQAVLGADTRTGDWTLAMNARYASKQFASDDNSDVARGVYQVYDAYVVADAKVSYRIDRNLTASLSIDNLFDREYFSFYPAPRRSWFAELGYRY